MIKKSLIFTIFVLLSLPGIVLANAAVPLTGISFFEFFLIILIEIIVFYVYLWIKHRKLRGLKFSILKGKRIVFIVIIANIATTLPGFIVPVGVYKIYTLITLGIAFVLSFLIEWGIYVLYFRKSNVSVLDSFITSCTGNVLTYLIILMPPAMANVDQPYLFDRYAKSAARNAAIAAYSYYADHEDDKEIITVDKLKKGGYKDPERNLFYGITLKQNVRITMSGDIESLKITTWHDKGEHVFIVDSSGKISKKLKTGETLK